MIGTTIRTGLLAIAAFAMTGSLAMAQTSTPFSGAKVSGGTVTHSMKDGKHVLTQVIDRGPRGPGPQFVFTDALARLVGLTGTQRIRWSYAATEEG